MKFKQVSDLLKGINSARPPYFSAFSVREPWNSKPVRSEREIELLPYERDYLSQRGLIDVERKENLITKLGLPPGEIERTYEPVSHFNEMLSLYQEFEQLRKSLPFWRRLFSERQTIKQKRKAFETKSQAFEESRKKYEDLRNKCNEAYKYTATTDGMYVKPSKKGWEFYFAFIDPTLGYPDAVEQTDFDILFFTEYDRYGMNKITLRSIGIVAEERRVPLEEVLDSFIELEAQLRAQGYRWQDVVHGNDRNPGFSTYINGTAVIRDAFEAYKSHGGFEAEFKPTIQSQVGVLYITSDSPNRACDEYPDYVTVEPAKVIIVPRRTYSISQK